MTTHVQQVQHSGSGTSITATVTTTAGNLLMVGITGAWSASATISSVTDSTAGTNVWNYSTATQSNNPPVAVVHNTAGDGNWWMSAIAWSRTTAGVTSITVNFSASAGFSQLVVEEFSGVPAGWGPTGIGDTTDYASPTSPWTSPSVQVQSGAPVMIQAACNGGSSFTGVSTSGYSLASGSTGAWGITTGAGATSCAFTFSSMPAIAGSCILALGDPISYNTGTSASQGAQTQATVLSLTIPVGVLTNDAMLLVVDCFTANGNTGQDISVSGGGGAWTALAAVADTGDTNALGFHTYTKAFKRTATAGDPGASLSIQATGGTVGGANQFWTTASLASYTGATGGVDVFAANTGDTNAGNTTGCPCPTGTTGAAGEWAVYLAAMGVNSSGTINGIPAGTTQRQNQHNSGVESAIVDSNGSVGAAGTSVGGGKFTGTNPDIWYGVYTVTLSPVAGGGQTAALTVAQENVAAPAPALSESLALSLAQETVNAPAPTSQVGPVSSALTVAQESVSAPAPTLSESLALAVAQESLAAPAPAPSLQLALNVAHVTIAAKPLLINGGGLPPLGLGAGGVVSRLIYGGSVTRGNYGGEVS